MADGDWMLTYTGRQFWPCAARPEAVCIEDIAHALSLTCRFGGHVREFYSVAQHSVIVCDHLPARLKLHGLLHDAAEAYLGDVIRPVKKSLVGYAAMEQCVLSVIYQALLGATPPADGDIAPVRDIDERAVLTEGQQLTTDGATNWGSYWQTVEPLPIVISPLPPADAEALFLRRAEELNLAALRLRPQEEAG